MKGRTLALAQQLTGKQSLEECSVQELKQLAQRYPYFAPAQFLLLQKLRQDGSSEEAEAQYKKAVLYYPNPLQFELFIASGKFFDAEIKSSPDGNSSMASDEENEQAFSENKTAQEEANEFEEAPVFFIDNDSVTEPNETGAAEVLEHSIETEEQDNVAATEPINAIAPDATNEKQNEQDEAVSFARSESLPLEQSVSEPSSLKEEMPAVESEANALTFEPFHTVDYFASQGIKISQEELPKDKLGKQMKSFTEWLKSMKRLPASRIAESIESTAEKKVESLADRSVSDSEVVTEAMAEVWAKQGNPEKALDIYNKLVLLNPSKMAYFAAKIETLKQS